MSTVFSQASSISKAILLQNCCTVRTHTTGVETIVADMCTCKYKQHLIRPSPFVEMTARYCRVGFMIRGDLEGTTGYMSECPLCNTTMFSDVKYTDHEYTCNKVVHSGGHKQLLYLISMKRASHAN